MLQLSLILQILIQLSHSISITLTPCGKTGFRGPILSQCLTAYAPTFTQFPQLRNGFTVTNGVQSFLVPVTGWYTIEAYGASGGQNKNSPVDNGGNGARMKGDFALIAGQRVYFIVGQKGLQPPNGNPWNGGGGGGGGSFVMINSPTSLFLAAGGGAGSCLKNNGLPKYIGLPGTPASNGATARDGRGAGGTNGNSAPNKGGKGWLAIRSSPNGDTGYNIYGGMGGFGGGGGGGWGTASNKQHSSGGGGGYSGGGITTQNYYAGGGGGSYNIGSFQSNGVSPFVNVDGRIIFRLKKQVSTTNVFTTTKRPTFNPLTRRPTFNPISKRPTFNPLTRRPTFNPISKRPTFNPLTRRPTFNPISRRPTFNPTKKPIIRTTPSPGLCDCYTKFPIRYLNSFQHCSFSSTNEVFDFKVDLGQESFGIILVENDNSCKLIKNDDESLYDRKGLTDGDFRKCKAQLFQVLSNTDCGYSPRQSRQVAGAKAMAGLYLNDAVNEVNKHLGFAIIFAFIISLFIVICMISICKSKKTKYNKIVKFDESETSGVSDGQISA